MGLDMFAFTVSKEIAGSVEVDFKLPESVRLHYWRKHPGLHGWMEKLYRRKGGKEDRFDCASVRLLLADLVALERAVKAGKLPATTGFFFGVSNGTEREDDLKFIEDARKAIAAVFYDSWW